MYITEIFVTECLHKNISCYTIVFTVHGAKHNAVQYTDHWEMLLSQKSDVVYLHITV